MWEQRVTDRFAEYALARRRLELARSDLAVVRDIANGDFEPEPDPEPDLEPSDEFVDPWTGEYTFPVAGEPTHAVGSRGSWPL